MPDLIPILLGLFVLAALLRIDTYFSLVYLLAAAYVVGRLWSVQTMRQLRTRRRLVNRAFPGEEISVELEVANQGWLPVPWVEMHDSLPVEMIAPPFYRRVITMLPRETRRFTYTLTCHKRGYYTIGPMTWRTGDLLGFAPQEARSQTSEYIIIYPRVLPLQKLGLPTRSPLASLPARAPLFEDPTRISGVRPYRHGDSPRRIHWTASAGAGSLLVKRYQPAIARETLICLDLAQEDYAFQRFYAASELAVITAASLANHIIVRENLSVGLCVQATDPLQDATVTFSLPPRRERAHLMGILEILARVKSYAVAADAKHAPIALPQFLRRQSLGLSWGTTIIVITGRESEALLESLLYLKQQGFAVALLLVMPPPTEPPTVIGTTVAHTVEATAERSRNAVIGLPAFRVWREEELELL